MLLCCDVCGINYTDRYSIETDNLSRHLRYTQVSPPRPNGVTLTNRPWRLGSAGFVYKQIRLPRLNQGHLPRFTCGFSVQVNWNVYSRCNISVFKCILTITFHTVCVDLVIDIDSWMFQCILYKLIKSLIFLSNVSNSIIDTFRYVNNL